MLGANRLAKAAQVDDALLNDSDTLLLQLETDPQECAALTARARHAGVPVVLHVSPSSAVSAEILRATNVLVGNSREIGWLGERLGTGNNPASIHAALGVTTVRMLGPQGADAMSPNGYVHMSPYHSMYATRRLQTNVSPACLPPRYRKEKLLKLPCNERRLPQHFRHNGSADNRVYRQGRKLTRHSS